MLGLSVKAMLFSLVTVQSFRSLAPRIGRLMSRNAITTSVAGEAGTESFRIFFGEGDKTISPWHDIPLKNGDGERTS